MGSQEGIMKRVRDVFKENRKTAWRRLAEEIGGAYEEGGLVKIYEVHFRHRDWEITMDTFSERRGRAQRYYTRIVAGFLKKTDFDFGVSRQTKMSRVFEHLGAQDILIGIPEFDEQFVVKGEDEGLIRTLLRDEKLRAFLHTMGEATFFISGRGGIWRRTYNEEVHEVIYSHKGIVTDVDYLKQMFMMVAYTLDLLVEHGVASSDAIETEAYRAVP